MFFSNVFSSNLHLHIILHCMCNYCLVSFSTSHQHKNDDSSFDGNHLKSKVGPQNLHKDPENTGSLECHIGQYCREKGKKKVN